VPELERAWESVAVCHNSIVGISRGLAVPAAAIFSDYSIAPTEEKKKITAFFSFLTEANVLYLTAILRLSTQL